MPLWRKGYTAGRLRQRENEQIERYIKPLNIDFVVMGSHGATGIRELVIGNNTQRIVRKSSIPVLVINLCRYDGDYEIL